MRDTAGQFTYVKETARSKLGSGMNLAESQQGNEYTRVETGAGGAQFVAVGVKKRDRRTVEDIEREIKLQREGGDQEGNAAKRAKPDDAGAAE